MLEIDSRADEATYTLCRPVGELDAYTVGQFREALAELAATPPPAHRPVRRAVHGLGRPRRAHRRHPPGPRGRGRRRGGLQPAHPHPPAAHHRASIASSRSTETRRRRRRRAADVNAYGRRRPLSPALAAVRALSTRRTGAPRSRPRPSRSCTSDRRNGTRTTGAGATDSASPARCVLLAAATSGEVGQVRRRGRRDRSRRASAARSRTASGGVGEARVHAVDDQRPHRRCRPRRARSAKNVRLLDGVASG